MKLTIDRNTLQTLIRAASPAVATRTTIPALKCFKITGQDDTLTIAATNTDDNLHITGRATGCEVRRSGVCLVSAATLTEIAKLAPAGPIDLSTDKILHISHAAGSYKVPMEDVAHFPDCSEPDGGHVDHLPAGVLVRLFSQVGFCAADKSDKYACQCVLLETVGNQLFAVATDTTRMAIASARLESGRAATLALVPITTVRAFRSAFAESEETVRVTMWSTQVRFATERVVIHSPLMSGKFVPWQLLLEKMDVRGTTLLDSPQNILAALRRVAVTKDDRSTPVIVTATGDTLSLSLSGAAGEGEVEHVCPHHEGTTETIETKLYPDHLCDFLELAASEGIESLKISLEDNKKPAWFEAGDWRYMTMPMVKTAK